MNNDFFVIKVYQGFGNVGKWYYYDGSTYIVQGEIFGSYVDDIRNAKEYKSKKRATNAMERLKLKVFNWDKMEVVSYGPGGNY